MNELDDLRARVANLEALFVDLTAALKGFGKRNAERVLALDLPPASPSDRAPAPNTDWASARYDLLAKKDQRKDLAPGLAYKELSDQLVGVFKRVTGNDYVFEGAKDAQAVQRLVRLRFEDRAELLARWEQAIKLTAYPGTKSIAVFATRVNEFGNAAKKREPISAPPVGDPYT